MRGACAGEVLCLRHAADLPAPAWSALAGPADFYLSQPWLRVAEEAASVPMWYLLSTREGELAAGLATALADSAAPWLLGRPDTVLSRCEGEGLPGAAECRRRLPDNRASALLPSLVCGGRHVGRNRVLHRPPEDSGVIAGLVTNAERLARDVGAASVAFLYVDERDSGLREVLSARGYLSHVSGRYSWLSLPAGGFEGYLGLLTPHRRRRVRAERRRLAASGVQVDMEPLTSALIPRLAELESRLLAKYGLSHWRPELSERVLARILAVLADRAVVSLARAGGDIRGFGLILRFRDAWFAHRAGFDYAYQGKLPLYYETLFYRLAEAAAEEGVKAIHYGVGSAQAKLSRGCAAHIQRSYLRMLNSQ